jgi:hypothetical protein
MTVTADPRQFAAIARHAPICRSGVPKAVFLVAPSAFRLAEESALDNAYMQTAGSVDPLRAQRQHQRLAESLAEQSIPTQIFPGHVDTPDAVFPNNVFATAPGRLVIGAMKHPVRRREAERADIVHWFRSVLGYRVVDLRDASAIAELTGCMVIDRARGLGYCGLSERCNEAGAHAMHAAFGLRATLVFKLAPTEYHTNVIMSSLAGRGLVLAPDGLVDGQVTDALVQIYGENLVRISAAEKQRFVGNCIALGNRDLWMSEAADQALAPSNRRQLEALGFAIRSVPLDELEKAGGSLRCMIGEIY